MYCCCRCTGTLFHDCWVDEDKCDAASQGGYGVMEWNPRDTKAHRGKDYLREM
jgi:hypothetical protein